MYVVTISKGHDHYNSGSQWYFVPHVLCFYLQKRGERRRETKWDLGPSMFSGLGNGGTTKHAKHVRVHFRLVVPRSVLRVNGIHRARQRRLPTRISSGQGGQTRTTSTTDTADTTTVAADTLCPLRATPPPPFRAVQRMPRLHPDRLSRSRR